MFYYKKVATRHQQQQLLPKVQHLFIAKLAPKYGAVKKSLHSFLKSQVSRRLHGYAKFVGQIIEKNRARSFFLSINKKFNCIVKIVWKHGVFYLNAFGFSLRNRFPRLKQVAFKQINTRTSSFFIYDSSQLFNF